MKFNHQIQTEKVPTHESNMTEVLLLEICRKLDDITNKIK